MYLITIQGYNKQLSAISYIVKFPLNGRGVEKTNKKIIIYYISLFIIT